MYRDIKWYCLSEDEESEPQTKINSWQSLVYNWAASSDYEDIWKSQNRHKQVIQKTFSTSYNQQDITRHQMIMLMQPVEQ